MKINLLIDVQHSSLSTGKMFIYHPKMLKYCSKPMKLMHPMRESRAAVQQGWKVQEQSGSDTFWYFSEQASNLVRPLRS